ncbi:MAG TPA: iron-containing redox enzyme family protein [Methylomirabilota bacterium]|nr:iron-containing redox enzyme family protein [Methylomirabilota bacterium]
MDQWDFVNALVGEIVTPGLQSLMATQYFTELRKGTLPIRRLQGFALQHYMTNIALNKGFALCMVKYAHDPDLYKHFAYQYNEEQSHPDLVKKFGLALGLKEEDFQNATFIFECLSHTGAALRGMLTGSPAENRTWALVNESMVCRYSEEFYTYLKKNYELPEDALEFFKVHWIADQDHTRRASEVIERYADSARQQQVVREIAKHAVRFKVAKFDGIYREYA